MSFEHDNDTIGLALNFPYTYSQFLDYMSRFKIHSFKEKNYNYYQLQITRTSKTLFYPVMILT